MKRHGTAWKLGISAALLALMGLSAGAFYARRATASPDVATAAVSRGSIVAAVSASGTLEAVTTVQVGTQVSGTVQTLYADFNSIVRKGQVLARIAELTPRAWLEARRAAEAAATPAPTTPST